MAKTRKQRLEEQRKTQATLEQTKNLLRKAERRASVAEEHARRVAAVPIPSATTQDILDRAFRQATDKIAHEMGPDLRYAFIHSGMRDELAQRAMIRCDMDGTLHMHDDLSNDSKVFTVRIPSFRLSFALDYETMRSMGMSGRGRSPTFGADRDMYMMERIPVPSSYMDPYVDDNVKVF